MLCSLLLAGLIQPIFKPPFERITSVAVKGYGDKYAISGNSAYLVSAEQLIAVNLNSQSKRTLYKGERECWIRQLAVQSGQIYAIEYSRKSYKTKLAVLNEKTGKVVATVPLLGDSQDVATSASQIFVSLKEGELSGLDIKTRKPRWTTKLSPLIPKDNRFELNVDSLSVSSGVVLANCGSVTFALDGNKGTVLWSQPNSYISGDRFPISGNTVFVPMNEGVAARDLRSGKALWINEKLGSAGDSGIWQGKFFTLDDGKISLLDVKTGKLLWEHQTQTNDIAFGIQYASVVNNLLYVAGRPYSGIYRIDGSALWQGDADYTIPKPVWSNGTVIATWTGEALSFYRPIKDKPLPTSSAERQALAKKLAEKIAVLDKRERDQLVALGDDAFTALLSATVRELDKNRISLTRDKAIHLLFQITFPKRTPEIIAALRKLDIKSDPYWQLIRLLAEKGEPGLVGATLLDALSRKPGAIKLTDDLYAEVVHLVTGIKSERTIDFSIHVLNDLNADSSMRLSAYINLATIGGEKGRAAVLKNRTKQTILPTIEKRLALDIAEKDPEYSPSKLIKKAKSKDGRTFGLFYSGILGGYKDLWIAEFAGNRWMNARFTGIAPPPSYRPNTTEKNPIPQRFEGKTAEELVNGDWISALADNPVLAKDSDNDGLTDVMEARLGTNPNLSDSDGDGNGDETDPWPTTVTRAPQTDDEKIFALAFEVMVWESAWVCPGELSFPFSHSDFELAGWPGPLFSTNSQKATVPQIFAADPVTILFITQLGSSSESEFAQSKENPFAIQWNATKTEARISLGFMRGSFSAGSIYTIEKIDGEWFVVNISNAWIT